MERPLDQRPLARPRPHAIGTGSGLYAFDAVPGRPPAVRTSRGMMFKPSCVLVTGGAGFIGSTFVRWVLHRDPRVQVVNLDLLTYAGNLESLDDVTTAHGP